MNVDRAATAVDGAKAGLCILSGFRLGYVKCADVKIKDQDDSIINDGLSCILIERIV